MLDRAEGAPPLDVSREPSLEGTLQPAIVGEPDVVGDPRVEVDGRHPTRSPVEVRPRAGAVLLQGAVGADRVRTLEDPVLPGGEPGEDLRLHRLRAGEPQARLHARERIGRKAGALLEEKSDLVVPVEVVGCRRHQAGLEGLARRQLLPEQAVRPLEVVVSTPEPSREA